jgi:hypothetical protein
VKNESGAVASNSFSYDVIKDYSLLIKATRSEGGSETVYRHAREPWHAVTSLLYRNSFIRKAGVRPYYSYYKVLTNSCIFSWVDFSGFCVIVVARVIAFHLSKLRR